MKITKEEFITKLANHKGTFQINFNSDVDECNDCGLEAMDLYFDGVNAIYPINGGMIIRFNNEKMQPVSKKEDGTNIYPVQMNSCFYITKEKIEYIDSIDVEEFTDVFSIPSEKIFNVYMISSTGEPQKNIIAIGLID